MTRTRTRSPSYIKKVLYEQKRRVNNVVLVVSVLAPLRCASGIAEQSIHYYFIGIS